MSNWFCVKIFIIFTIYVALTELLISGYEKHMDKLLKINTEIIESCAKMSEGEDLDEVYFR